MIENFGRLLMQQPVPVFVLLGFHFLIKASVVISFVHNAHLLQNRNSRLISFENQAAMYAIFSSANWNLCQCEFNLIKFICYCILSPCLLKAYSTIESLSIYIILKDPQRRGIRTLAYCV